MHQSDEQEESDVKASDATAEPAEPAKPQGPSKAQRRRVRSFFVSVCSRSKQLGNDRIVCDCRCWCLQEKLKKQEQERNERIEAENKNTVSERQIEADIILSKLKPHNLVIKDIPSDGHCMYHAVADQMKRHSVPYSGDVRCLTSPRC